jgi:hypothetical protein
MSYLSARRVGPSVEAIVPLEQATEPSALRARTHVGPRPPKRRSARARRMARHQRRRHPSRRLPRGRCRSRGRTTGQGPRPMSPFGGCSGPSPPGPPRPTHRGSRPVSTLQARCLGSDRCRSMRPEAGPQQPGAVGRTPLPGASNLVRNVCLPDALGARSRADGHGVACRVRTPRTTPPAPARHAPSVDHELDAKPVWCRSLDIQSDGWGHVFRRTVY